MSKTPTTPTFDRRRLARLASEGVSTAVLAEIAGMPRLELEAALQMEPQLAELRRYYEKVAAEPPEARFERLRRLLLATIERHLEDGDLRNIGWALKSLGLLEPLGGTPLPEGSAESAREEVDRTLEGLGEEERQLWEAMGYENWPVPPTIPWRPDAPRPRGPLEIENEAGTEAERAAAPLPWPPPRRRSKPVEAEGSPVEPATAEAVPLGPTSGSPGEKSEGAGTSRWPPHLRPV
jgi:hypothetical protein